MTTTAAKFAEVAVWAPVHGTYSYGIPSRLGDRVAVGARVLVPFGKRGITGVILGLDDIAPEGAGRIRDIESVLDANMRMSDELIALCKWIASYYEAPIGEVLRTAMPAGTKVKASTRIEITDAGRVALESGGALTRRVRDVLGTLVQEGGRMSRKQLLGTAIRGEDLDALMADGLIAYSQKLSGGTARPRTVRVAMLAREITDDDRASLGRARKRLAALERLEKAGGEARVADLRAEEPHIARHLRQLADADLVRFEDREIGPGVARVGALESATGTGAPPELNARQVTALSAIREGLGQKEFSAYLLHGITGSGKTEIYLHAIAEVLDQGGTAIVLVPEISLTPQLAARFRARFGDRVAVLHSGLSQRQRFDEWHRLASGSARIALGARSAIFAPVTDLRIVVVDEEHDSSFKQDEGVRYHGRDVALVRAQRAGAVCILGSATPSLESFHGADSGRYHLLELPERATPRPLPEVELIDLRTYHPDSEGSLSAPLARAIAETLERGEQTILFLNRRGFATVILCVACGHSFQCLHCSVSLTYHRGIDRLMCHYCGFVQRVPLDCPSCETAGAIVRKGFGTEKVAAAVGARFPGARVARLDRDVASGTNLAVILDRVARHEIDILVGTQMVTKGHDFPGVTLVGVLCADIGMSLPDFRASERTFQLLTQVAGRAGRGDRPGRVLIQSYRPDVPAIIAAAKHDYLGFFRSESAGRQEMGYPPFGFLVAVRIDGNDPDAVEQVARSLAARAEAVRRQLRPGCAVLGPSEAPLVRLKGRTRWHVWLRAPERKTLRRFLRQIVDPGAQTPGNTRVTVDVDPISAL